MNSFSTNVGDKIVSKILPSEVAFETYLKTTNSSLTNEEFTKKELKDAFQCLRFNKSPKYDKISSNIIKTVFRDIYDLLGNIFENSLTKGIYPDDSKIALVTPIFKTGEKADVFYYRPIFVLP